MGTNKFYTLHGIGIPTFFNGASNVGTVNLYQTLLTIIMVQWKMSVSPIVVSFQKPLRHGYGRNGIT